MHGAILPNNIILIAFVLHNLTPSIAGSLFFPSIVDLDSAVKYFHSPKFNVAMKSFKQDFSKYVRSMFVDLSLNIASKFKGFYDTLDTYTDNEILTGSFLLRRRNGTQHARQSQSETKTKLLSGENHNVSKNDLDLMNSSTVLKELHPNAIDRTDQKMVKMKNSTRRKTPRFRGYIRRLNNSRKSTILGHNNSEVGHYRFNNSIVHSGMIGNVEGNSASSDLSDTHTIISEVTPTANLRHNNDLKMAKTLSDSLEANAEPNLNYSEETSQINEKTSESSFKDFHNFSPTDQMSTTEFTEKTNEFTSNSGSNTSLFNILSGNVDLTRKINNTFSIFDSHSTPDSRFLKLPQPSKLGALEEGSEITEKQQLLAEIQEQAVNNVNFKYIANLTAAEPIRMSEEERELLAKKPQEETITEDAMNFYNEKLNASNGSLRLSQYLHTNLSSETEGVFLNSTERNAVGPHDSTTEFQTSTLGENESSSEKTRNTPARSSKYPSIEFQTESNLEVKESQRFTIFPPKFPDFESEALENFNFGQKFDTEGTTKNETDFKHFDSLFNTPPARNNENSNEILATETSKSTKIITENNLDGEPSSIMISTPVLLRASIPEKATTTKYLFAENDNLGILSWYEKSHKNMTGESSLIPATMKPMEKNDSESTTFVLSKAADGYQKFGSESIAHNDSKLSKQYYAESSRKISIRKDKTSTQTTARPRRILIKSRIKKRAAYDAMMNMIASRWAKANNEEAEVEETVIDDMQGDEQLEVKLKESNKPPTIKKANKADHEVSHTYAHDFTESVKISKHESSLPHDIHGKISNLCLSFDTMSRKNKTEVLPPDQPSTTNDWISTSSAASLPKLKRSFSVKNNRTSKVVKRKSKRRNNQRKTVTPPLESALETDRLLDIALEQFEDKLKSIIQSSWPRRNFRDPVRKSEDFLRENVQSTSKSTDQKDLHNYVVSTCKQTWDELKMQKMREIEETDTVSENLEEEPTTEVTQIVQSADTSTDYLSVLDFDQLMKTTPQYSETKETLQKMQKLVTSRQTMPYPSLPRKDLRMPLSNKQRNLERFPNHLTAFNVSEKSSGKQQLYCPPCELAAAAMKRREESGEEPVIIIGTHATKSSATTEKYFLPSEFQYPRGYLPVTITDEPRKSVDPNDLETWIKSVSDNTDLKDDTKSDKLYQPNLVKPTSETYFHTTNRRNFRITPNTGMRGKLEDSDDLEASIKMVSDNEEVKDDINSERRYQSSLTKPKSETYVHTTTASVPRKLTDPDDLESLDPDNEEVSHEPESQHMRQPVFIKPKTVTHYYTTHRLNLPTSAVTGMPEKLVDSDDLKTTIRRVSDNKGERDDIKSERLYQPIVVKPTSKTYLYTTEKPTRIPTFKHTIQRPTVKGNIMKLDRKPENFPASPTDSTVSYKQNPENLRRSIENFKKIARLNWELLKNIDADDGFSIAEFNPELLGLPSLSDEPTARAGESDNENLEDEPETLSNQSSDRVTQSLLISLRTSPQEVQTPKTPKVGHENNGYTEPNKFFDHGRLQSFERENIPKKCDSACKNPPLRLFTRSDVHGYNNQEVMAYQPGTVIQFSTQNHDEITTTPSQNFWHGNEPEIPVSNKPESLGQINDHENLYKPEFLHYSQLLKAAEGSEVFAQNHKDTEEYQNVKSASQTQLEKPENFQDHNPKTVDSRQKYDIMSKADESPESFYSAPSVEAELDEKNRPSFTNDQLKSYFSSASEGNVSEIDCNPRAMKSESDLHSVKVRPNASVSELCRTTSPMNRNFITPRISTRQEIPALAVTLPRRPTGSDQVESNNRTARKHSITNRKPYPYTTSKFRVSDSMVIGEDHRPSRAQYHKEESQYIMDLKTQGPSMKEYPPEESQTNSAFKLGLKKEMTVRVEKCEVSSTESLTEKSYFHSTTGSLLNRTALRKRLRSRKTRVQERYNSGHHGQMPEMNYNPSTERIFRGLQGFNGRNVGFDTEKLKELINERDPAKKSRDKELSETENNFEGHTPRLSHQNKYEGKRIRFYNRGNHPLSQFYEKEYRKSRKFLSSSAPILKSTTLVQAVIQRAEEVQETSPPSLNGEHKLKPKRRKYSKRRRTTTSVYQNTDELNATSDFSY